MAFIFLRAELINLFIQYFFPHFINKFKQTRGITVANFNLIILTNKLLIQFEERK